MLIVVAHPEPGSFNHALAEGAAEVLRRAGHDVVISDLARQGFRADAGPADVLDRADATRFHLQSEQAHATRHGTFAPDILREQERVASADILILQFPLWWGGPPALLKGWIDRVMSYGFAYVDGRRFETGLFKGRRALMSVTTGGTPQRFSEGGVFGPIGPILMPIRRLALEYMGYKVAEPVVAYGVPRKNAEDRQADLDALADAALSLANLPVTRSGDWQNALDAVPEGAWSRRG
ncbi:NAD(P)H-dependent oxidoreductase [Defluviimonas sp. SAOS-178_SWC]|uniref:NAD(P)H-dependent oxidoreductase n=1 Tax=Defluviimonas sp. SAOS-178_SWC TaxID=3121287 RepID=UPI003221EF8E